MKTKLAIRINILNENFNDQFYNFITLQKKNVLKPKIDTQLNL